MLFPFSVIAESIDISTLSATELLALWQSAGDRLKEIGAYPYIELSKGDEGIDVTNLQTRLSELYYYSGELTGKYDSSTVKAVKTFEKANGLKQNGIMSIDEQDLLYSDQAVLKTTPTPKPTATPAPTPVPDYASLQITSVKLRDYYNTKVFSLNLKNNSTTDTIDAFTVAHRCYDSYDNLLTVSLWGGDGVEYDEWWKELSLKPKKTFSMGSYFWYLFSYQTCSHIEVAVSKFHTTDGRTVVIDPDDYQWVSGDL